MVDNPSADKFDPPPGAERFEPPRPPRRGTWLLIGLSTAYFAVEQYTHWSHPRGAWAAVGLLLMVLLAAVHFVARRRLRPEEDKPYSDPQYITR